MGLVFVAALLALLALHGGGHAYRLSHPAAVRAALADPQVHEHLATHPWTRAEVHAFDDSSQRVSFLAGPRLVLDAAVEDSGRVPHVAPRFAGVPPSGALVTFNPLLWLAMAAVLALAAGSARLRSLRTLDLAALLALLAPIACYREGLVAATVLAALPSLTYLLGRCAWVALRGAPIAAAPSLYDRLTAAWEPGRGARLLVLLSAAVAVMVALVSITSNSPSDVDLASMSGATLLLHGTLPYGHMPTDVVHGDTYPLLNYAFHVPAALLAPVRDGFDDLTGGRSPRSSPPWRPPRASAWRAPGTGAHGLTGCGWVSPGWRSRRWSWPRRREPTTCCSPPAWRGRSPGPRARDGARCCWAPPPG